MTHSQIESDIAAVPDAEALGTRAVEVSDTQAHLNVDPHWLTGLIEAVLDAEKVTHWTLSVTLVDDATIRVVNARHLGHDWPTDVISFPLSGPDDPVLAGELVVSAEMAAATAREADLDPWAELALYVVHGLLHLLGYDDRDAEGADVMRRHEGEILARLGLENNYPLAAPGVAGASGQGGARCSA